MSKIYKIEKAGNLHEKDDIFVYRIPLVGNDPKDIKFVYIVLEEDIYGFKGRDCNNLNEIIKTLVLNNYFDINKDYLERNGEDFIIDNKKIKNRTILLFAMDKNSIHTKDSDKLLNLLNELYPNDQIIELGDVFIIETPFWNKS